MTCTFGSVGQEQTLQLPAGVTKVHADAVGGAGSTFTYSGSVLGSPGAFGADVAGDIAVPANGTLYVEVAGNGTPSGGWNGGGAGGHTGYGSSGNRSLAGGGGASDVRTATCGASCPGSAASLATRELVAGGG
ncbi:MAG: hypothetical protein JWN32_2691, partial [Solirubrobacterales bacterium]|nr:hypothetical protein [Solirubrobacterales bacterium]